MALTDIKVRAAKPTDKQYKLPCVRGSSQQLQILEKPS